MDEITDVQATPTSLLPAPKKEEKGVANLNELRDLEVLRLEFTSSRLKPKVILSYETISFSKACLDLLLDIRFINVLIDRVKKRIIILPVDKHAKDAFQWCSVSNEGNIKTRLCTAKKFGEKLFDMMHWVKENKYRVLAYYQLIEGVRLLVFNLKECEMVVPEFITTKTGKIIKRGHSYLPGDWNNFGMSLDLHNEANSVELNAHYMLSDQDIDVTISDVRVKGSTPTEEEIIMSQYRREKQQGVIVNG
ncbi:MAG: hypothetical protein ACYCWE_02905 [Eubacteriales bacterium]